MAVRGGLGGGGFTNLKIQVDNDLQEEEGELVEEEMEEGEASDEEVEVNVVIETVSYIFPYFSPYFPNIP